MNYFLDLGSHYGDTLQMSATLSPCTVHAFEPNPDIDCSKLYPAGVIIHREAVWTFDGEIDFYINPKLRGLETGSSAIKEKITGELDKKHPVKVRCIDFSAWLISHVGAVPSQRC